VKNTSCRRKRVRLWAVDIDANGQHEAATVLVMATDVHGALKAVERRHPELMRSGRGKAWLCDHAIYRPASGRFEYKRLRAF
jgi:hypothetical protein